MPATKPPQQVAVHLERAWRRIEELEDALHEQRRFSLELAERIFLAAEVLARLAERGRRKV